MANRLKLLVLCVLVVAALLAAAAGGNMRFFDVVGKGSVEAFGTILDALPEKPAESETADGSEWSLSAPDKSARFLWSANTARLEVNAAPFVKAGLDPEKLPDAYAVSEKNGQTVLTLGMEWGRPDAASGALAAYGTIVDAHRDHINYHSFLDHYGVKVGGGNMFEWAKDMQTNGYDKTVQDKDIVFALNPKPLIEAGADPKKVDGWLHAEVPVMTGGSVGTEWLLLKPFDL